MSEPRPKGNSWAFQGQKSMSGLSVWNHVIHNTTIEIANNDPFWHFRVYPSNREHARRAMKALGFKKNPPMTQRVKSPDGEFIEFIKPMTPPKVDEDVD
mgnify:CR=1 FL=1